MIKKNKNKINAWIVGTVVMVILVSFSFSTVLGSSDLGDVKFKNPISSDNVYDLVQSILTFIVKVGAILAIFFLIYAGYLFVTAQGSEDKIEKARTTFFWTIVGGLIVIGAKTLADVICNTAESFGASCQ